MDEANHRLASAEELAKIAERIENGFRQALLPKHGINYTPGASHWKSWKRFAWPQMRRLVHVHLRYAGERAETV